MSKTNNEPNNGQNAKIIFGLKVKQLRQKHNLSFKRLCELSGLSVSYLNEIEKAKKYPRKDKIQALARALNTSYDHLTNPHLSKRLAPIGELLNSNFLHEIPLELFGLDVAKIVELMANAPTKVGAFISALMGISRKYALEQENFYFASLRSYQALHENYFEDLEEKVEAFVELYELPTEGHVPIEALQKILKRKYRYKIEIVPFEEKLSRFRSIYIPDKKKLLVNEQLTETQQVFLLGKEIAFNYLKLKKRTQTSTFIKVESFEEVLNNFKASYFAVALLINRESLKQDLKQFFSLKEWKPKQLLAIMNKYKASPEMFFHRFGSIAPRYFGLNQFFFLRFNNTPNTDNYTLTKELHFNRQHHPYGNGLSESYCRRWITLWLLEDLNYLQRHKLYEHPIAGIQRSKFIGTQDEYLCFSLAQPAHPTPNTNVSVTVGMMINDQLKSTIQFWNDPNIQSKAVNQTCERCAAVDCTERVAPPVILQQQQALEETEAALNALLEGE